MMPETQIHSIARQMLERHGFGAIAQAAQNAQACESKGDSFAIAGRVRPVDSCDEGCGRRAFVLRRRGSGCGRGCGENPSSRRKCHRIGVSQAPPPPIAAKAAMLSKFPTNFGALNLRADSAEDRDPKGYCYGIFQA